MKYLNIKKALAAWQDLQPLSEKDRDRLSRRFTVDFNYNSNHMSTKQVMASRIASVLARRVDLGTRGHDCSLVRLFGLPVRWLRTASPTPTD